MPFWLWIVFHPRYWSMLYPYDEEWDNIITKYLDEGFEVIDYFEYKFKKPSEDNGICELMIGDHLVWVANYPFGYCTETRADSKTGRLISERPTRPSKKTIKRFHDYIKNHEKLEPQYYI